MRNILVFTLLPFLIMFSELAVGQDSAEQPPIEMDPHPLMTCYIPYNVFTPGEIDGLNDVFTLTIEGEGKYDLQIRNRWGDKVFESTDKNDNWNGKVNNTGAECAAGTYYYILNFTLEGGKEERVNGTVTLIRSKVKIKLDRTGKEIRK